MFKHLFPASAVCAAMSSHSTKWPKKTMVFAAFSWHLTSPRALDVAKAMVARQRTKRQSPVDLESAVWLPDGVQLTYWVPTSYHSAYAWFSRLLGEIPAVHGDTSDWRLEAHEFVPVVGAAASVAPAEAASVALDVAASANACGSGDAPKSACKRTY